MMMMKRYFPNAKSTCGLGEVWSQVMGCHPCLSHAWREANYLTHTMLSLHICRNPESHKPESGMEPRCIDIWHRNLICWAENTILKNLVHFSWLMYLHITWMNRGHGDRHCGMMDKAAAYNAGFPNGYWFLSLMLHWSISANGLEKASGKWSSL